MCLWEHKGFTKPYFLFLVVWLSYILYPILFFSMLLDITNLILQPTSEL